MAVVAGCQAGGQTLTGKGREQARKHRLSCQHPTPQHSPAQLSTAQHSSTDSLSLPHPSPARPCARHQKSAAAVQQQYERTLACMSMSIAPTRRYTERVRAATALRPPPSAACTDGKEGGGQHIGLDRVFSSTLSNH